MLAGYEIEVLDSSRFPWYEVLKLVVVECGFLVRFSRQDDRLKIACEQPT